MPFARSLSLSTKSLTASSVFENPIASGIVEHVFKSSFDGTLQTFLEKDFGSSESKQNRLVFLYLHGALSNQEQGMTARIYNGAFERWGEELARRGAVYICPEYRGNSWMGPAAEEDILNVLQYVNQRYPGRRLIVAGGSMGGTSALIFASRFPKTVDRVIAFCPATSVFDVRYLQRAVAQKFFPSSSRFQELEEKDQLSLASYRSLRIPFRVKSACRGYPLAMNFLQGQPSIWSHPKGEPESHQSACP